MLYVIVKQHVIGSTQFRIPNAVGIIIASERSNGAMVTVRELLHRIAD